MLDWSTVITQLETHAAASALVDKARQGLEACFASEGGCIDGWSFTEIRAEFDAHRLAFGHAPRSPVVETRLTLHAQDGYPIGDYRSITGLDGLVTDDFLVFHKLGTGEVIARAPNAISFAGSTSARSAPERTR